MKKIALLLTALTLVLAACGKPADSADVEATAQQSDATVHFFADASVVEGASSQLTRVKDVVFADFSTNSLAPDRPHTMWYVVFNTPKGCSEACNEDDIFDADGNMSLNPDANISILFADGAMSDSDGNASFSAMLEENRATGEVLVGPGLTAARKAEVHLVIRDHGDIDPSRAYEQLSTFEPECADCVDVQFAVHQPKEIAAKN